MQIFYLCLPLKKNIPEPKNNNWKVTHCVICGAECWETEQAARILQDKRYVRSCTCCALRAYQESINETIRRKVEE